MFDDSRKRRLIALVVGVGFVVIVMIVAIVNIAKPWRSGDPAVRKAVVAVSGTEDFTVSKPLVTDGEWKLYWIDPVTKGACESAPAVMKGDRMVIGPGTDVPLDDFYKAGVPDKIVRYIFKDDVLWYGFETYGREHGRYSLNYIKPAIQAMAMKLNIRLDRVSLDLNSIKDDVNDPKGVNRTEISRFNFTINNNKTKYTLTATDFTTINKLTINIDDENGQTLFNKTFNAS
ncbi:hypothetical protein [Candidatus Nanoperiomorbus periodonticus]|uniref:hypothetical protein n=1 Tax=Candidatus Nanoperiomorbus periodonticus TaxID=2171989 RepID=UPI00101D21A4|nr:hypothetical protein [Candidatus Nanoperiomorbus periodonticus]RYC76143.1 hypothetical protein G51EAM_00439 [Candidatus Nanoperiomorbus periodonticus]